MDIVSASIGVVSALILTSIYNLIASSVCKRVTIRSPEAQSIAQIRPAVNALIETNGPMMQGIIAILEAQKGQCNGNVDEALDVNRKAKKKFDAFLIETAKVEAI